jgi:hypothetical protein
MERNNDHAKPKQDIYMAAAVPHMKQKKINKLIIYGLPYINAFRACNRKTSQHNS